MGSLSPKTRNAQVDLYQSGDVDFLVATDAIGMGINMDLDQVYFSNLKKFDGKKLRKLNLSEICLLYTSPSPRDMRRSRMPSSA